MVRRIRQDLFLMFRVRRVFAVVLFGLAGPAVGQTTLPETNSLAAAQLTGFIQARNAEIAASIATVNAARAAQFERTRNAEIETVLAAYREAQFARQRNAEIDGSISAVSVERGREYVRELNARANTDRAAAEAEFARARNAEIDAAIAASQETAFARARNAEAEASIAAVNVQRVLLDTGAITAATPVERQLRKLAAAFCWTLMLLSILMMAGGLIARRWRARRAYLGAKLHLAHEAQSARRALSRMTDQIRSTSLRLASLDGSR
jgi:hypothetical protein